MHFGLDAHTGRYLFGLMLSLSVVSAVAEDTTSAAEHWAEHTLQERKALQADSPARLRAIVALAEGRFRRQYRELLIDDWNLPTETGTKDSAYLSGLLRRAFAALLSNQDEAAVLGLLRSFKESTAIRDALDSLEVGPTQVLRHGGPLCAALAELPNVGMSLLHACGLKQRALTIARHKLNDGSAQAQFDAWLALLDRKTAMNAARVLGDQPGAGTAAHLRLAQVLHKAGMHEARDTELTAALSNGMEDYAQVLVWLTRQIALGNSELAAATMHLSRRPSDLLPAVSESLHTVASIQALSEIDRFFSAVLQGELRILWVRRHLALGDIDAALAVWEKLPPKVGLEHAHLVLLQVLVETIIARGNREHWVAAFSLLRDRDIGGKASRVLRPMLRMQLISMYDPDTAAYELLSMYEEGRLRSALRQQIQRNAKREALIRVLDRQPWQATQLALAFELATRLRVRTVGLELGKEINTLATYGLLAPRDPERLAIWQRAAQRGWLGDHWPQLNPSSDSDPIEWYGRWLTALAANQETAKGLRRQLKDSPATVRAVLSAFIARRLALAKR